MIYDDVSYKRLRTDLLVLGLKKGVFEGVWSNEKVAKLLGMTIEEVRQCYARGCRRIRTYNISL